MDEKPAPAVPHGDPADAPGGESVGAEQRERCGPLQLQRLRKDDGRALIVYRRAGEEP